MTSSAMAALHALVLLSASVLCIASGLGDGPVVETGPMYGVTTVSVSSAAPHPNNFLVNVSLAVTGPPTAGAVWTVPGFYDGNSTWRVRFACNVTGQWTFVTSCAQDPALNGLKGAMMCKDDPTDAIHGALRPDPEHPHHMVQEDGTRFFMLAYEADWLWALGLEPDSTPISLEGFLDSLEYGRFNTILVNVYANFSSWGMHTARPSRVGPTSITPWTDAGQMSLDLRYWQQLDRMMLVLQQRGIVAHLMMTVWNKNVNWPPHNSPADDLFWSTVIARYQAFSNLLWDPSKEAQREADSYWQHRIPELAALDAHQRPITLHSHSNASAATEALKRQYLAIISNQGHRNYRGEILADRRAYPDKPIVNVEFLYEMGPIHTYGPQSHAEDMREVLWNLYTAGGYGAWYYSPTAWDVIVPGIVPTGYGYCRILFDFFAALDYWLLEPLDSIGAGGVSVLGSTSLGEFVLYANSNITSFGLVLEAPKHTVYNATWLDPRSGQRTEQAMTLKEGQNTFSTPTITAGGDAILYLTPA